MIGIDTNVLLRFLVDDDDVAQNQAARTALAACDAENPIFVSSVTIVETVWVLTRVLGFARSDVYAMLRNLLASDGVVMQHGDELGLLLGAGNDPPVELADYLIAWSASEAGCEKTLTFDRSAAHAIASMDLLS